MKLPLWGWEAALIFLVVFELEITNKSYELCEICSGAFCLSGLKDKSSQCF